MPPGGSGSVSPWPPSPHVRAGGEHGPLLQPARQRDRLGQAELGIGEDRHRVTELVAGARGQQPQDSPRVGRPDPDGSRDAGPVAGGEREQLADVGGQAAGQEFPLQRLPRRFRRRSGLRLRFGFRLGQRSRPGPGFRGRFRRPGLRLWLGLRPGHRPRPGFRRLRPWSRRRPRRRLRVRRPRLRRFGTRRFRQYRLWLAGIAGYFARVSAGVICCHPGIVPCPAPATRAAAVPGQVACTRAKVSRPVRDDSMGVGCAMLVTDLRGHPAGGRVSSPDEHVELTISGGCCTWKRDAARSRNGKRGAACASNGATGRPAERVTGTWARPWRAGTFASREAARGQVCDR